VTPIPIQHGTLPIVGYRIGNFAYITDAKVIPDIARPLLKGVDTLVITALRKTPHPAHMSLGEALRAIDEIAPRQAFLSHIAHDMGRHADVELELPPHVRFATDGMVVQIA
ncbi:MAG TPA: MBL fold metallo-hydrolase, partial [Thermomicrobiales bacterium]|nr:MBL fold metallo-hydrolase [Thermomicrobiales bacterium]